MMLFCPLNFLFTTYDDGIHKPWELKEFKGVERYRGHVLVRKWRETRYMETREKLFGGFGTGMFQVSRKNNNRSVQLEVRTKIKILISVSPGRNKSVNFCKII